MSVHKTAIVTGACLLFATQILVTTQHASLANPTMMKVKSMDNWELLGTRVVDYTMDHDLISIRHALQPYVAVRVRVKEGVVHVHKSVVHFANGDVQDMKLPEILTKVNDDKIIDLKGDRRLIEKITFWYDTQEKADQKSVVEVWGRSR